MILKKIRYLLCAYLSIGFAKLLFVEIPPIVSVTAIILRDQKVLCVDLSYFKGLGLPGGLITADEEPTEALAREVKEETGFTVTRSIFLGTASAPFRNLSSLTLVYLVDVTGTMKASQEGTLLWLDPKEAYLKLTYPNAQLAIKRFVNKN